jgi:lysophospholipase L1-like esterase
MNDERFASEVAALARRLADAGHPPGRIVVYGSSTVRLWRDPCGDLGRDDVVAVGFGGATLADLTRHVDTLVAPLAPRRLVVAAGTNDLERDAPTTPELLGRVQALVAAARRHDAALPVDVLTLKPAPCHAARMPAILAANRALAQAVAAPAPGWEGVTLVDTCTPFLGADGLADPAWYGDDRRHMNARGQALWVQLIGRALPGAIPTRKEPELQRRHR